MSWVRNTPRRRAAGSADFTTEQSGSTGAGRNHGPSPSCRRGVGSLDGEGCSGPDSHRPKPNTRGGFGQVRPAGGGGPTEGDVGASAARSGSRSMWRSQPSSGVTPLPETLARCPKERLAPGRSGCLVGGARGVQQGPGGTNTGLRISDASRPSRFGLSVPTPAVCGSRLSRVSVTRRLCQAR